MENVMIFENPEFGSIRTISEQGEPWFSSTDVCNALELAKTATRRLDEDEKGLRSTQTLGGLQEMMFVNEAGLYTLILGSRKPAAKEFKRWITHEVIPSIRRHGAYVTDSVLDQLDSNPDLIPDYLHRLRTENAKAKDLRQQLAAAQNQLAIAQPKADYYNTYIDNRQALCFRYVAKELKVPERKLIQYLLDRKLVYRDAHRGNHVFPCSGPWQHLFIVRDFYDPYGRQGQYTLLTPAGKEYLMNRKEKITAHQPKQKPAAVDELCPAALAGVNMKCTGSK